MGDYTELIIGILALVGTMSGTFYGVWKSNRLVMYRLDQLEQKVMLHNNVVEKVALLRQGQETYRVRYDELKERVKDLESKG